VDTSQPDPEAAAAFYGGLFGWELEERVPAEAEGNYINATIRGRDVAAISSIPEGAPQRATWNTYIWVESADGAVAKVRDAGGGVEAEPFDAGGAGRMAWFTDSEGAPFRVEQGNMHRGAEVVNEHGSVNFNDLHTRDAEAAKRFYGAVFGWETFGLEGGFQAWTLSGYGDHLEKEDPELRKRIAETGGPEGFEDVVASLVPIGDDQPDTPPHWGVTFAVDDADEIASKAEELGGKVIVPPMDAPWVRMTVIADPAGATFNASKYAPENKDLAA
jgi:predicted enzyme related to lactoylglutathione lyase